MWRQEQSGHAPVPLSKPAPELRVASLQQTLYGFFLFGFFFYTPVFLLPGQGVWRREGRGEAAVRDSCM